MRASCEAVGRDVDSVEDVASSSDKSGVSVEDQVVTAPCSDNDVGSDEEGVGRASGSDKGGVSVEDQVATAPCSDWSAASVKDGGSCSDEGVESVEGQVARASCSDEGITSVEDQVATAPCSDMPVTCCRGSVFVLGGSVFVSIGDGW